MRNGGQECELCQDVGQLRENMHSIQIVEERRSIFDHFPFCDAWQWIFLAASMYQRADPRCQWTAHVYTESCRITIILQITRCNDCNTFKVWQPYKNLKIIKQTVLLASGVQQCVEPFPHLAAQHACLSTWPMATCL